MNHRQPPGMEDLRRRRQESLEKTEKAIADHPDEYRQIKQLLGEILARPVEITEYYRIARALTGLLEQLNALSPGSLFAYYHENIAPELQGDTRYFKMMCADLREQIDHVDRFRRQRHNLRVLRKPGS